MLNENELIDKIRRYDLNWLKDVDKKDIPIRVRLELKDLLDRFTLDTRISPIWRGQWLTISMAIEIIAVEIPLEYRVDRKRRLFSNIFKRYQQNSIKEQEPCFKELKWILQQKDRSL